MEMANLRQRTKVKAIVVAANGAHNLAGRGGHDRHAGDGLERSVRGRDEAGCLTDLGGEITMKASARSSSVQQVAPHAGKDAER